MTKDRPQIPPISQQAAREIRRNSPLRQARTCYDHLAGVAGVTLMDTLLQKGWLEETGQAKGRTHFRLTQAGEQALLGKGVVLPPVSLSKRMYAYGCIDWTERRFHLGGALGAAILQALIKAGTIRREPATRVVPVLGTLQGWTGLA